MFKPYRILGTLLVLGVLFSGRFRLDRTARLTLAFLFIGFLAGVPAMMDGEFRKDIVLSIVLLWCFNLATYVALASVINSPRDVLVLAIIHAVAMLLAAYGIAEDARASELELAGREFGDFRNPANAAISMLFACISLLTALRWIRTRNLATAFLVIVFGVTIPVFFLYTASLTGSRSGAALLLLGVIAYYVLGRRNRTVAMGLLAGTLAVAVVVAAIGVTFDISTLAESNILAARVEKKGMDTDRLYLWLSGLDALVDTFGLGVGIGGYPELHKEYFAQYAHLSDPRWLDSDLTLHNDYVIALVEHGVLGLVIFLLLCAHLLKVARSISDLQVRAIAISLLLGTAINGVTHAGLPYFALWFYFALLVSWQRLEREGVMRATRPRHAAFAERSRGFTGER